MQLDKAIKFDRDIVSRYNKNGPRYTSYPTALQFDDAFDIADYDEACRSGNDDPVPAPLSLYFHIPFCNTVCFYCACNKIVTKHQHRTKPYLAMLEKEIDMVSAKLTSDRVVEQLHFGGGTPSFLSEVEMEQMMWKIQSRFNACPADSKDYSIEIDPRSVTPRYIQLLATLGFNRYSLGVQDVDIKVQKAINRIQSPELTNEVIHACREAKAKSISIDLIYGLPLQTPESFQDTINSVIEMNPDRLSVFNYAHLPTIFKPQRRINAADLPSPDDKLIILQNTIEQLTQAGYVYIGMDHFAKPDDELVLARMTGQLQRNFQGYTTHGACDLIAMGVSSISKVRDVFSQNHKDEASYSKAIELGSLPICKGYVMTAEDILRADIIQRLSCYGELDKHSVEQKYDLDFNAHFKKSLAALQSMIKDELLFIDNEKISVMPKGRLLVRNICMAFDQYSQATDRARFSNAI